MSYLVKKPRWLKKLYGKCTWEVSTREKILFLTFDDGPHPSLTPFVLEELKKYEAKATFFCLGANVERRPELYQQLIREGHAVGNHTYSHFDGWRTRNRTYYDDVLRAQRFVASRLFRPPHGHITPFQVRKLRSAFGLHVVMWSIMSGDFDPNTAPEQCYSNVASHAVPGSIVVLHDNDAAGTNLRYVLPRLLSEFSAKGYRFLALSEQYLCC
jgi:peptidoglycan/xylan/chitin deacetylase (PgdA/CDA1 family)